MTQKTTLYNQAIPVITVDGPVGSGKGTLSVMLAKALGFHLLDSGALYRVLALATINNNMDLADKTTISTAASDLNIQFKEIEQGEPAAIILDGRDVSHDIRSEKCGEMASKISKYSEVRNALLSLQYSFVKAPGLVADGRDMGTVVFQEAPVKFFLTASQELRAQRRFNQLLSKDNLQGATYESLLAEIQVRDERDINRAVAPLYPADDATIIDSTGMTINQVYEDMLAHVVTILELDR